MSTTAMRTIGALLFFTLLDGCNHVATAAAIVAQQGDAAVTHDASAGTWTLSAGGASLTLALDPSRDFGIVSLVSASGTSWATNVAADSTIRVGTRSLALGSRAAGFAYRDVSVAARTIQRDQTPEDVVGAVVYLSGPGSDFVTGQSIVIDGGQTFH